MQSLRQIVASVGGEDVATCIQSGNVVFHGDFSSPASLASAIAASIDASHGFAPAIHLVTADDLAKAIQSNPYPDAVAEPKSLHLCFLDEPPDPDGLTNAKTLASESESFQVLGKFLYLHAPEGIARSKLVKGLDRALGTSTTARNWRTVLKIAELASTINERE